MARFSGAVGYAESQEGAPGVWSDVITEKTYFGDVIRDSRRLVPGEPTQQKLNDDISASNAFSIVGDAYAFANFTTMRYVMWNGKPWTITNVEVRRPRLILQIGGLWSGDTA
jgi:hypothetical protein